MVGDNAEAGYPGVPARPVGHPVMIADHPAVVVQFRMDKAKLHLLDQKARAVNLSRSELLRAAVDRFSARFVTVLSHSA